MSPIARITMLATAVLTLCVGPTAADPVEVNQRTAFTNPFTNPCTSEMGTVTGFVHTKTQSNATDGFTHVAIEMNVESAQGVATSGARYIQTASTTQHENVDLPDGVPSNFNLESIVHLTRLAEDGTFVMGDDFYLRVQVLLMFNANGDLTKTEVDVNEDRCR